MVDDLNRMMRGWANYFSLEQVSPAYRAIDRHAVRRLYQWLCRRHEVRFGRTVRFPDERLWQQYGLTRLVTRISQGAPSTVCRLKPSNQALQDVKDEHWPTRSRLARHGHRAVSSPASTSVPASVHAGFLDSEPNHATKESLSGSYFSKCKPDCKQHCRMLFRLKYCK